MVIQDIATVYSSYVEVLGYGGNWLKIFLKQGGSKNGNQKRFNYKRNAEDDYVGFIAEDAKKPLAELKRE